MPVANGAVEMGREVRDPKGDLRIMEMGRLVELDVDGDGSLIKEQVLFKFKPSQFADIIDPKSLEGKSEDDQRLIALRVISNAVNFMAAFIQDYDVLFCLKTGQYLRIATPLCDSLLRYNSARLQGDQQIHIFEIKNVRATKNRRYATKPRIHEAFAAS